MITAPFLPPLAACRAATALALLAMVALTSVGAARAQSAQAGAALSEAPLSPSGTREAGTADAAGLPDMADVADASEVAVPPGAAQAIGTGAGPLVALLGQDGAPATLPEVVAPLANGPQVAIGAGASGAGMPAIFTNFANGVTLQPHVPYWAPSGFRPLSMDIYSPPAEVEKPEAGFPVLVFIHGGGWSTGDAQTSNPIADFPQLLAGIAAQGYVVASVNYRLSGEAKWPAQGQDIKAALRYLRSRAPDYGIDPNRFATWGISAGAQLSAIAATTCGVAELQPEAQILPNLPQTGIPEIDRHGEQRNNNSDCVQAAVAWAGVYDMSTLTDQARLAGAMSRELGTAPEWRLLGCISGACPQDKLASASAVQRLSHDAPPILLMTGSADKIIPYTQTLEFAGALEAERIPHELVIISGAGHNFIGRTPAETRRYTQTALDHMLAFLAQNLQPKP